MRRGEGKGEGKGEGEGEGYESGHKFKATDLWVAMVCGSCGWYIGVLLTEPLWQSFQQMIQQQVE